MKRRAIYVPLDTVSSSEDVTRIEDGSTTEVVSVAPQGDLVGKLSNWCIVATDNLAFGESCIE